jgi:hypothetical protein
MAKQFQIADCGIKKSQTCLPAGKVRNSKSQIFILPLWLNGYYSIERKGITWLFTLLESPVFSEEERKTSVLL